MGDYVHLIPRELAQQAIYSKKLSKEGDEVKKDLLYSVMADNDSLFGATNTWEGNMITLKKFTEFKLNEA